MTRVGSPRRVFVLAFVTLLSCRTTRLPRATQVERELRLNVPNRPQADQFFATLHAMQSELGVATARRSTTQVALHAALDLPPSATLDASSTALQRILREAHIERIPFRVHSTETQRAARARWEEFLVTDDAANRRAAFAVMETTMEVDYGVTPAQRQQVARALDPCERHLRRVATLGATMERIRELAADMENRLSEVSLGAPESMRAEFQAARLFLESVGPKVDLQIQESRRTELWLRGVFVPEGETMTDQEFLEQLNELRQ